MITAYELDFIPVGTETKSGDAISLRYLEDGVARVHVVDGGTEESGDALAKSLREHYRTSHVDHVVLTHSDGDHSSGLRVVMREFSVGALWMNRPWLYAAELLPHFADPRYTAESLARRLRADYPILAELEDIANTKGVPIYAPFQGSQIGPFTVVSPSKATYLSLVPHFPSTPRAADTPSLLARLSQAVERAEQWIWEHWHKDSLRDEVSTSHCNESSVVQLGRLGSDWVLLTGDAGPSGLMEGFSHAVRIGYLPGQVKFLQVPHHGSRHNVTPAVLDAWLGPIQPEGSTPHRYAIASVAAKSTTHPRQAVVNAFIRRGTHICSTKGKQILHVGTHGFPNRGWPGVTPHAWSNQSEPWD